MAPGAQITLGGSFTSAQNPPFNTVVASVATTDAVVQAEAFGVECAPLQLDPKLAPAHNNLGTALTTQGRHHEAVVAYRRAVDLDPARLETAHVVHGRLHHGVAVLGVVTVGHAQTEIRKASVPGIVNFGYLGKTVACAGATAPAAVAQATEPAPAAQPAS